MENKIIVITGAATGIGLAIAKELMDNNTVVSIDRNAGKIAALKANFPKIKSVEADITSSELLADAVDEIGKQYGRIDILINNAGKGSEFDFIKTSEKELMDNMHMEMEVNYHAPIMLIKKALPLLKKSPSPVVVICSSGLAYMPLAMLGSYCASKAAIHSLTMTLRHQLRSLNVKVVELLPPTVDTELNAGMNVAKMPADVFAKLFIKKLLKGDEVINIGQSASLEKFSRLLPRMAFKMMNK